MEKIIITEKENGKYCSVCSRPFIIGEYVVLCENCESLAHESCFKEHGCGSQKCSAFSSHFNRTEIVLTKEEVSNVIAVPENTSNPSEYIIRELNKGEKPLSKMAIFSSVFADIIFVATLLLFFISIYNKNESLTIAFYSCAFIGGIIGIILSTITLSQFNKNKKLKGLPFAFIAIFTSMLPIIGGVSSFFYKSNYYLKPIHKKEINKKQIAEAIEKSASHIQEPMKSNVIIKSGFGLSQSLGSGVVVKNKNNTSYIITNVHVLTGGSMVSSLSEAKKKTRNLSVTFYTSDTKKADVIWVAPEGIDLALISCPTPKNYSSSVKIGSSKDIKMGEKVFAIGNPMGLDWTYTEGVVSSFRNKEIGKNEISVIQIQTPLNHGNSGGGLYSTEAKLVGINTWIYEKAQTEGLNFSIAIDELTKRLDTELLNIIKD